MEKDEYEAKKKKRKEEVASSDGFGYVGNKKKKKKKEKRIPHEEFFIFNCWSGWSDGRSLFFRKDNTNESWHVYRLSHTNRFQIQSNTSSTIPWTDSSTIATTFIHTLYTVFSYKRNPNKAFCNGNNIEMLFIEMNVLDSGLNTCLFRK